MSTKYKILFIVELLNKYYSNLKCADFKIVPSAATAVLLKNHQMVYKVAGNQLAVLVKVKGATIVGDPEEDKPFITIDPKTKFVFYLDLQNMLFTTVTNLDTDKLRSKHRFYFSNLNSNKVGSVLNLSKKVSSFPSLQPYEPGDLVDNGVGAIFECIQSTGGVNATGNTDFWYPHDTTQLVSSEDMLTVVSTISRYKTNVPATRFIIEVFGYNVVNGMYDKRLTIKNSLIVTGKDEIDEVLVDLSELKPGRYKVNVNATVYDVWVDDDMVRHSFFGVIELYPQVPTSGDFDFLDSEGKVKDRQVGGVHTWLKYTVLYGSRLAYWKYLATKQGIASIDGVGNFSFLPTPAAGTPKEYFTSNKPVPLQQTPWEFKVHLSAPTSNEPPLLPNPNPVNSGMFSRTEPDKDYYCTIYLNY